MGVYQVSRGWGLSVFTTTPRTFVSIWQFVSFIDDLKDNVLIIPFNLISWLTLWFPYPIFKKCMISFELVCMKIFRSIVIKEYSNAQSVIWMRLRWLDSCTKKIWRKTFLFINCIDIDFSIAFPLIQRLSSKFLTILCLIWKGCRWKWSTGVAQINKEAVEASRDHQDEFDQN